MNDVIGFLEKLGKRTAYLGKVELLTAVGELAEAEQAAILDGNVSALAECGGARQYMVCAVFAPDDAPPAEDMPLSPDGDDPVDPALPESQVA